MLATLKVVRRGNDRAALESVTPFLHYQRLIFSRHTSMSMAQETPTKQPIAIIGTAHGPMWQKHPTATKVMARM